MYLSIKPAIIKTVITLALPFTISACGGSGQGGLNPTITDNGSLNPEGVPPSLNPLGAAAGTNNSGSLNPGGAAVGQLNPSGSLNAGGAAIGTFNSGSLNPFGAAVDTNNSGSLNPGGAIGASVSITTKPEPETQDEPLADTAAFISTSPTAALMVPCIQADTVDAICSFETLPLIGLSDRQNTAIDKIMSRVIVSHTWMGTRIQAVLETLPTDMLPLFDAVTSIVIDDDVRPAYYDPNTGAIYLDPSYLWLTPEEAATINPKTDFRADFDAGLQYISATRTTKNGQRTGSFHDFRTAIQSRSLSDILDNVAALLLHELAHANDFFPVGQRDQIDSTKKPNSENALAKDTSISQGLFEQAPLVSSILNKLGQVSYLGRSPTSDERALTAQQAGEEFEQDHANVNYAYASSFEDTASLFEEAMMKYFFDIDQDTSFLNKPADGDSVFCEDYTIAWGVRNRIGDIHVKDRAQYVVSQILPNLPNIELFFQDLPSPTSLNIGGDWCLKAPSTTISEQNTNIKTPFSREELLPK